MDTTLKEFLTSGKQLLSDTKRPRHPSKKESVSMKEVMGEAENNPHKIFVRRTIKETPPKKELVEQMKRFIEAAEAAL